MRRLFSWMLIVIASFGTRSVYAQDSIPSKLVVDSAVGTPTTTPDAYSAWVGQLFDQHTQLGFARETPLSLTALPHVPTSQEPLFYLLFSLTGILAFLRFAYPRYMENMFRVFFNTSLRQNQLTDQLAQARLASLCFNLFFVVISGFIFAQIMSVLGWIARHEFWTMAVWGMLGVAGSYGVKAGWLRLMGWATGQHKAASRYVFIVFLINKMLGVLLLPVAWILAFSVSGLQVFAAWMAVVLVALMLLVRFVRSYGSVGQAVQVSSWHFFLYVIGLELLPLLLIGKGIALLFMKMR